MTLRLKRFEPQRSYKWRITISNLSDTVLALAESVTLPSDSIQSTPFFIGGSETYLPYSKKTISDITIVFTEDVNGSIAKELKLWKEQMTNSDGTYNYPTSFYRDIKVELLSGSHSVTTTYRCINCWPNSTTYSELNFGNSDAFRITQVFSCNSILMS